MRNILSLGARLMLITLVAGLALGGAQALTAEPIRQQALARAEQARREFFGDVDFVDAADDLAAVQSRDDAYASVTGVHYALREGRPVGCVVSLSAVGYGGSIALAVGVDAQGRIVGIRIGEHQETPGLGAKARDAAFTGQFIGKTSPLRVVKSARAGTEAIHAITGATVTSQGVTQAVNLAADLAGRLPGGKGE